MTQLIGKKPPIGEGFQGYRYNQSRRIGIKGRSAGGIG